MPTTCDGWSVVRTGVAQLEMVPNTSECSHEAPQDAVVPVKDDSDGSVSRVMPTNNTGTIIFDITSEAIGEYRIEALKSQQVRYANPVRSVRIREQANMASDTAAYALKNDAVVVTDTKGAWSQVETAVVDGKTDGSNEVVIDTDKGVEGSIVTRWLRDPNPSDLVRIFQADSAYWSDIARVKVAHLVNVRAHPWYGAKIVHVLPNAAPVSVISTVDNWSEIRTDDASVYGYIRSDFLVIEKMQRREPLPLLR